MDFFEGGKQSMSACWACFGVELSVGVRL